MEKIKLLLNYAKNYWKHIALQILFATFWVGSNLIIPILMANIIDYGIARNDMNYIIQTGLQMILVTVLNIAFLLVNLYFLTQANAGISRDLRRDIFSKVINFSAQSRQDFSRSTLITRNVNDVKQVSNFIDLSLRKIYTTSITVIGAVALALALDLQLALIMLIIVPVVLFAGTRLTTNSLPQYALIRRSIDKINRLFNQNISGIRVVKAFNKTDYEESQFQSAVDEAYQANVKAEKSMMLLSPLVTLAANFLILIILWVGAGRVAANVLKMGILVAMLEYVTMALDNIRQLSSIITIVPRSQVSLNRIEEVLNTTEKVKPADKTETGLRESQHQEGILFDHVTFYYPDTNLPAVKQLNTKIVADKTTAIIGSTGSGKSTILRLILRDFDVSEGQILIDGMNNKHLVESSFNKKFTLVPQQTFLFSGTVRENILMGRPDASDEEIWEVLDASQMGDFFRREEGLDTRISQAATNLSGGQKQRIAIARGLIRNTDYYLFDDCFSALDYTTERKVRQAIIQRLKNKTIIVVAQRVATVEQADQILVMENGQLVGSGRHKELLASSKVYQEIVRSQNQEEVK